MHSPPTTRRRFIPVVLALGTLGAALVASVAPTASGATVGSAPRRSTRWSRPDRSSRAAAVVKDVGLVRLILPDRLPHQPAVANGDLSSDNGRQEPGARSSAISRSRKPQNGWGVWPQNGWVLRPGTSAHPAS